MKTNNDVMVPVRMDKNFKNALLKHCKDEGMYLSGLVRKLLREYAEQKGITK